MKSKLKICPNCGKEFQAKYNSWKGYQTFYTALCGQRKIHQKVYER